ncbi:acylphosphatase [Xanthobacteraceae bacterium Astr-EGSB]|uniref:acylphosphatase n=1 Tax=Astrobacterium formosum TaxID=3069710 RepID=UPI0027AF31C2|nr:acylphosphatase [Xanthobacteraceae bacterium Astr-EGSB]
MSGPVVCHVIVSGRVQGCGFRAWTERQARGRDLDGWVRNRRDGTVEAVFCGPAAAVEAMIAACHQGPALSRVTGVVVRDGDLSDLAGRPAGQAFVVLSTV